MIRWPWSRKNPARELAMMGVEKQREKVKAKARQMCAEMGRPVPEALR